MNSQSLLIYSSGKARDKSIDKDRRTRIAKKQSFHKIFHKNLKA
jgi:hypothetical protein